MAVISGTAESRDLGTELRRLRKDAGLNTRVMAERAGVSNANISFWETGKRLVPLERLTALLDALSVTDDERERIIGLRRKADGPGELTTGSTNIGQRLTRLIELERTATRITHVQPLLIPGLLQTSEYARAVLGEDDPDVDTKVALRAGRRDVITRRRNPVNFLALIDSEALVRPVGSPEVMADQLDHLAKMGELPNVTIQIVPSTAPGYHPMLAGPFVMFEFLTAPPIVLLEHHRTSAFIWDRESVAAYLSAPAEIQRMALGPERSLQMAKEIAKAMETT
ncbi:helix-turn-helix transcriptional regulator [Actinophytocola sp.]|uniref:helix-turn-helix domain-containing protein n=1 Tax=Actinophytocola sp. TaxID=1872138 RepID=UPI002D6F216D|nr:helix-turn-helix transcriptional regulator [Actinophytocola sp.]HYQ69945.1 helix-turn-helix transcriptional regulator [Actinophytocola sp.]